MRQKKVTFTDTSGMVLESLYPVPSKKMLPGWYKNIASYITKEKRFVETSIYNETVKKCIPFADSLLSGYTIPLPWDIYISQDPNAEINSDGKHPYHIYWSGQNTIIEYHEYHQLSGYPGHREGESIPKFINPWSIKTPPGYSCLFLTPMHQDIPFKIWEGIVDTDKYHKPVNLLFNLRDRNFEGKIEAGTPMVQIIPFKRESWTHEILEPNEDNLKVANSFDKYVNTYFKSSYRNFFWQRKEFS